MKAVCIPMTLFGVNTYIVYDEDTHECAIIDPGIISKTDFARLIDTIDSLNLRPVHLINTHMHIDHALGNNMVKQHYGLTLKAHRRELPLAQAIPAQAQMFGLGIKAEAIDIDSYIDDGETIPVGHGCLKAILVPGHSPGSIVLYDPDGGFLIAGDVIFQSSIGRTDLPGGDHAALIAGIRHRILTLPDDTVIYPGHGPATTVGSEKKSNPFLV